MFPRQSILYEMLTRESILYEMLPRQSVLYEMLLYKNVLYIMLLDPKFTYKEPHKSKDEEKWSNECDENKKMAEGSVALNININIINIILFSICTPIIQFMYYLHMYWYMIVHRTISTYNLQYSEQRKPYT